MILKGAANISIALKLSAYMLSAKSIIACVDEGGDTASVVNLAYFGWALLPEDICLVEIMKIVVALSNEKLKFEGKIGYNYARENLSKRII